MKGERGTGEDKRGVLVRWVPEFNTFQMVEVLIVSLPCSSVMVSMVWSAAEHQNS